MLEQFGHNSIAPRGVRTTGFKPLLVVLVQGEGRPPLAHDKAYYEDFFFGPKNSVASYFQEISHGRFTWTRLGAGIQNPTPGTTVTEIALASGFTQLGRFAGQYREAYGELPSTTLQGRASSGSDPDGDLDEAMRLTLG